MIQLASCIRIISSDSDESEDLVKFIQDMPSCIKESNIINLELYDFEDIYFINKSLYDVKFNELKILSPNWDDKLLFRN